MILFCAQFHRRNIYWTCVLQQLVMIHLTPLGQYPARRRTPLRSNRCLTQSPMIKYAFGLSTELLMAIHYEFIVQTHICDDITVDLYIDILTENVIFHIYD